MTASFTLLVLSSKDRGASSPSILYPKEESGSHCLLIFVLKPRSAGLKFGSTIQGRLIPKSEDIPGYCYVICDMTESVIRCCKGKSLQETADHLGYFGYNPNYKAYIEVISFDRLLKAAKERNRMFFQKLGIPTGL